MLCFDNLSSIPIWISDALCRLATGGSFGTRTLYENDEQTLFESKRPVILNGIEDFVTRGDLLERSIILQHPVIGKGKRRLEADLWAEFERAKPRLLGAILDRVVAGLREFPKIDKTDLPRMADACAFAIACESGMKEPARFLNAYNSNQNESLELILADSVIVPQLVALIDSLGVWQGTPTEFYDALKPAGEKLPRGWPKSPSALSGMLRRIAPALAKVHSIHVTNERETDSKRTRLTRISRGENLPESPSGPSDAVQMDEVERTRTTPDDSDGTSRKTKRIQLPENWRSMLPPD